MSKINETNYPRRTQANYEDTDMLIVQEAGGNTYTTRISDMREDYQETLAPIINSLEETITEVISSLSTGNTLKAAVNPTAEQIAAYSNGAIWIETT